ncbi:MULTISPECIES: hypothetical protein [Actinomyces]|uniref:hypothetical protein n=1 Tax=Actinomyces TaxID=1654 RepID=UPI000AA1546E|nr:MULTISPECIES: hypothetical protein [Actinomyces]BDH76163.1 hypothetical protein ATCC27039_02890 [Actinomyces naeslundii]
MPRHHTIRPHASSRASSSPGSPSPSPSSACTWRSAFGEPGDGKPVDGNPTERWNAPANREHLGGSPLFSGPGGAGSWEQLRGWTEARRAGNLTGL